MGAVVLVMLFGRRFVVAGVRCLGDCFCGRVVVVVVCLGGDFRSRCFALDAMVRWSLLRLLEDDDCGLGGALAMCRLCCCSALAADFGIVLVCGGVVAAVVVCKSCWLSWCMFSCSVRWFVSAMYLMVRRMSALMSGLLMSMCKLLMASVVSGAGRWRR